MRSKHREAVYRYAYEKYGTKPEYLWAKFPDYAVLRHEENKKWYAVIMDIPKIRLGLKGEGRVDILELKTSPLMAGSLELEEGILPAYHMKKGAWISVLLDGTVEDKKIEALLDMSYEITG